MREVFHFQTPVAARLILIATVVSQAQVTVTCVSRGICGLCVQHPHVPHVPTSRLSSTSAASRGISNGLLVTTWIMVCDPWQHPWQEANLAVDV